MRIVTYTCLLLFLIFTSSCNQEKTTKKISQTSTNSFKASVDGKLYEAIHVTGFITPGLNTLLLTGAMGTGEDIQFFLPKDIKEGTYDFTSVQGKYQPNEELAGFAIRGNIIITDHDTTGKNIKGSFYFTTKPMIEGNPSFDITDGSFNITY